MAALNALWAVSRSTMYLRIGMVLSLCQLGLHDIERHARPIVGLFKTIYLVSVNAVAVAAIVLLVLGLRRSREDISRSARTEIILAKLLLGITIIVVVGDWVIPIFIFQIANGIKP